MDVSDVPSWVTEIKEDAAAAVGVRGEGIGVNGCLSVLMGGEAGTTASARTRPFSCSARLALPRRIIIKH